jgi:hypothetical protein
MNNVNVIFVQASSKSSRCRSFDINCVRREISQWCPRVASASAQHSWTTSAPRKVVSTKGGRHQLSQIKKKNKVLKVSLSHCIAVCYCSSADPFLWFVEKNIPPLSLRSLWVQRFFTISCDQDTCRTLRCTSLDMLACSCPAVVVQTTLYDLQHPVTHGKCLSSKRDHKDGLKWWMLELLGSLISSAGQVGCPVVPSSSFTANAFGMTALPPLRRAVGDVPCRWLS